MKTTIIIQGNPIPKKRPRFARRGKFVQTYDEQVKEKAAFRAEFVKQYKLNGPCNHPVRLSLQFWMKRPKSHFRTGKYSDCLKENAPKIHQGKPDIDNLIKFVMDALNGAAWTDDCIIYATTAFKMYCESPRTIISYE